MGNVKNILGAGMKITPYTIVNEKIPEAFSGFRIVHLSDLHCESKKGLISEVANQNPDIIVMTGDMTDEKKQYGSFLKMLTSLLKIAPCYIISGNHDVKRTDYRVLVDKCKEIGAIFLEDESREIVLEDEKIIIHGVNDPAARCDSIIEKNVGESLKALKRYEGYEILLFHRANKLELFKDAGFDLILSGHMHGGQMRIPYFGGVLGPLSSFATKESPIFPKYSGGYYRVGESDAIVNCGLGNPVKLPRFGNPTELVLITLKRE